MEKTKYWFTTRKLDWHGFWGGVDCAWKAFMNNLRDIPTFMIAIEDSYKLPEGSEYYIWCEIKKENGQLKQTPWVIENKTSIHNGTNSR